MNIEKKEKLIDEKEDVFENDKNLKNFFKKNFSDSVILQKNFSEKLNFLLSEKKFLNFLFKIKKIFIKKFSNKKINFNKISKKVLDFNLKDFEENISKFEEILDKQNDFSYLNIFLNNEKEYLEIINCDLIFDFGGEKELVKITLQTDEFLKMVS